MRRASRTDQNHEEIVRGLRAVGASVTSLAAVGRGVADVLCGFRGAWHVLEVKKPKGVRGGIRGGTLTEDQVAWIAAQRAPVHVVRSLSDALDAIGAARKPGQEARS